MTVNITTDLTFAEAVRDQWDALFRGMGIWVLTTLVVLAVCSQALFVQGWALVALGALNTVAALGVWLGVSAALQVLRHP